MTPLRSLAAWVQAVFYAFIGIWPLVSRRTFEMVTGPKTDFWLVKTVGLLITVIGVVLGLGSAASLAAVDVVYVRQGRIPRVYLLDALAEVGLIALWVAALFAERRRSSS